MTRPPDGAPWPTSTTRPLAVLGWPVRHSLSPVIHNAALREQGIDLVYLALPAHPDDLDVVIDTLGALEAVGANVTVPHKEAVVARCAHLTEEARLIGAVNTLAWTSDGLLGDNTDAVGLCEAVTADVALDEDDRFVILGTGGAARAAAVAVGRLGNPCAIVGRRPDAAATLGGLAVQAGSASATGLDLASDVEVRRAVAGARVVINATSLGMQGESLPEAFHDLEPGQVAYDLIYRPPQTPFLRSAAERGVSYHNGLGMLVAQAAASYRRWTGREAPLATMSAVAVRALSHPPSAA